MTYRPNARKEIALGIWVLALNVFLLTQVGGFWGTGSTVFAQPYANGQACVRPGECASTFCVDGFCCNDPCDGTYQACNVPGQEGTCVKRQPAPALSPWGQVLAVFGLALVGAYLLTRDLKNRRQG